MSIIVSGRHVDVTEAMKEYAENKLGAVLEDKHKISSARIVLNLEKSRHIVEIIVHGKGMHIEAGAESYDMYESIDEAVSKVERQIEKHFDKKQDHHKSSHASIPVPDEEEDIIDDFEDELED